MDWVIPRSTTRRKNHIAQSPTATSEDIHSPSQPIPFENQDNPRHLRHTFFYPFHCPRSPSPATRSPPLRLKYPAAAPLQPLSSLLVVVLSTSPSRSLPPPPPPPPPAMASLTAAAVSIPRFTGLKAGSAAAPVVKAAAVAPGAKPVAGVRASIMREVGAAAVVATAASAILASSALAVDVKLGGDDGSLAFVPSEITVAAGEKITFKNNAGFPHNVVFDEDEVPSGVDASAISMSEEDLLNAAGEEYSVVLKEKGTYTFYCSPHQGAGMVGKVTVN